MGAVNELYKEIMPPIITINYTHWQSMMSQHCAAYVHMSQNEIKLSQLL